MAEHAFKAWIVLIRRAQQNGARQLLARLGLHGKQTLEAEHNVAVAKLLAQGRILNMRRTGAFMNILSGKVIVQRSARPSLATVAAKPGKQRRFCLVKRGDKLAVRQSQIVERSLALLFDIRVKQPGFELKIVGQLLVTAGKVILQRANREDQMAG